MVRPVYFKEMPDNVLTTGIIEMGRQKNGASFLAIEVIKWIYPQDWVHFTSELQKEIYRLEKQGRLRIKSQKERLGADAEKCEEIWVQVK